MKMLLVDLNATLTFVLLASSSALSVSAVLGLLYRVTAKPKLDRIEQHLVRLNGSVADAVKQAAEHEVEHIRHDSEWPARGGEAT